jgi:hypothetical protein
VAIDKLKVGDRIRNAAPGAKHGQTHRVDGVIVTRHDRQLVDLTVVTPSGLQTLSATPTHLFWDAGRDRWVPAGRLKAGDLLQTTGGHELRIAATHTRTNTAVTYDLTIHNLHTYYVEAGTIPVLVHNCSGRWKVGDDYSTWKNGKPPSMSTMRKRFWKNEAAEPDAADQYGAANVSRMKRGMAPRRQRPDGSWESMELSHEPVPARDGGSLLTPRWPEEHAIMDPGGHRKLGPGY